VGKIFADRDKAPHTIFFNKKNCLQTGYTGSLPDAKKHVRLAMEGHEDEFSVEGEIHGYHVYQTIMDSSY